MSHVGAFEGSRKGQMHLEHLDVGPCGEDEAVDAKNAEDDVVRGDGVEPSA